MGCCLSCCCCCCCCDTCTTSGRLQKARGKVRSSIRSLNSTDAALLSQIAQVDVDIKASSESIEKAVREEMTSAQIQPLIETAAQLGVQRGWLQSLQIRVQACVSKQKSFLTQLKTAQSLQKSNAAIGEALRLINPDEIVTQFGDAMLWFNNIDDIGQQTQRELVQMSSNPDFMREDAVIREKIDELRGKLYANLLDETSRENTIDMITRFSTNLALTRTNDPSLVQFEAIAIADDDPDAV